MNLRVWVGIALMLSAHTAQAQQVTTVSLVARAELVNALRLEQVRSDLEIELGQPVALVGDAQTPLAMNESRIAVVAPDASHVVLLLQRGDGSELRREAELPEEAAESVRSIVILAANLVRDEARELLALLTAPPAVALAPGEGRMPPAVDFAPTIAPAPAVSTSATQPDVPVAPPSVRSPPFLRVGADVHLGSTPRASGYDVLIAGGAQGAWILSPSIAIGVRNIGGGELDRTSRAHFDLAPFAEISWNLIPELQLYGQFATTIQMLFASAQAQVAIGVAPMLVAGARVPLVPEFSIGLETALTVPVTDTFYAHTHSLPLGAVIWTGGVSVLFFVN